MNDASNNPGSTNYSYVFNVCQNVDPSTPLFPSQQFCNQTGAPGPLVGGPAPAFQINNIPGAGADQCHRLGAALSPQTVQYGLYDPADPSRGLFLQYTGGDVCPSRPRSLKVWMLCDPDAKVVDQELVVEAPGTCLYEIFVRTAYGCPAECPIVRDANTGAAMLCSNHGFCGFDPTVGNSRCFCNDGYGNRDCSPVTPAPTGLSSVGIVLICVGIFLAGTLGFLVYLWMRIRSLRLDMTAYSSLRSGPDDHADTSVAGA